MRNITVSVDEETHRRARILAAAWDTSVSALVREFLRNLGSEEDPAPADSEEQEAHKDYLRRLDELFADWDAQGIGLRRFAWLTREEVYDRQRARLEMRMAVAEERNEALQSEIARMTRPSENTALQ